MKKYLLVALFIIFFGGIANMFLWMIVSYFDHLGVFKKEESLAILIFSIMYSLLPVFASLILIGFVEKVKGNKFIWWIHCIPLVIFMGLLIYWKSYFGMLSLSFYYLLGVLVYWQLIYKTRLKSNE